MSCGRLSAILARLGGQLLDRKADHIPPPRLNLRFWRPPSAATACSLTRARKSGRRRTVGSPNKVGAPGFEPGTSASRTQRSTELSHAPKLVVTTRKKRSRGNAWAGSCKKKSHSSGWGGIELRSPSAILARLGGPLLDRKADHTQAPRLEPTPPSGWGGIRTHEGINPHDFQSCALSRSATHPISDQTGDPDHTPPPRLANPTFPYRSVENGGSGIRTHADLRPTP